MMLCMWFKLHVKAEQTPLQQTKMKEDFPMTNTVLILLMILHYQSKTQSV
jgi:hypothetical protein